MPQLEAEPLYGAATAELEGLLVALTARLRGFWGIEVAIPQRSLSCAAGALKRGCARQNSDQGMSWPGVVCGEGHAHALTCPRLARSRTAWASSRTRSTPGVMGSRRGVSGSSRGWACLRLSPRTSSTMGSDPSPATRK